MMYRRPQALILLSLFVAALVFMPAPSHAVTGSELLEHCRNYRERPDKNLCDLYVSSLVTFVTSSDKLTNPRGKLCIGPDVPMANVVATITAWLSKNPTLHAEDGYKSVYDGLAQKYRCR